MSRYRRVGSMADLRVRCTVRGVGRSVCPYVGQARLTDVSVRGKFYPPSFYGILLNNRRHLGRRVVNAKSVKA